jgi:SPP1 family phage portal protein
MRSEEKNTKDKQIVDWMHICGIGVRMVLPDQQEDEDGSPASIFTLDPRDAFVIYYSGIGHLPKAGVVRQKNEDGEWISCVYTIDTYYEIKGNEIINGGGFGEPHGLGRIPIIEYANNDARMGAFEPVLSLLNAINTLESNRVDSVEDFVNAFDVFQNCEIDTEKYSNLSKGGKAIMIACTTPGVESKVYRITSELNQSGTQTIVDDVYDAVLTICGMPNRNGGSSTSDTGAATIMRDGWQSAESRAQDTEKMFVCSEREFLRQFLFICRSLGIMDLKLSDIEVRFTRRRYDGLQSKAQVFAQLYATGIVDPYDIYAISELFPDSGAACARGLAWKKQNDEAAKQQTNINSSEVLDS